MLSLDKSRLPHNLLKSTGVLLPLGDGLSTLLVVGAKGEESGTNTELSLNMVLAGVFDDDTPSPSCVPGQGWLLLPGAICDDGATRNGSE
jgi:hypothetical protein